MIRVKFQLKSVQQFSDSSGQVVFKFSPVYKSQPGLDGNACEENLIFGKYTPSGEIVMNILNPDAAKQFELGKFYYVDFTETEN